MKSWTMWNCQLENIVREVTSFQIAPKLYKILRSQFYNIMRNLYESSQFKKKPTITSFDIFIIIDKEVLE